VFLFFLFTILFNTTTVLVLHNTFFLFFLLSSAICETTDNEALQVRLLRTQDALGSHALRQLSPRNPKGELEHYRLCSSHGFHDCTDFAID
jgi:hypothetical protein